ncbi:conserved exported hypothetical protein [Gammaproteobacteria bacterium]
MTTTKIKYCVISLLIFTTSCCFAINKEIIDGANNYNITAENLRKVKFNIESKYGLLEYWSKELDKTRNDSFATDHDIKFCQNKIDETKKELQNLNVLFNVTKETLKTLEPLKREYDKQIERESRHAELKTAILNITGMVILPLAFFGIIVLLNIYKYKKYKRLLQSGKISQQEYDNIMRNRSTMFDDDRTNPATGLRMIGGIDSGGNPSGCSFKSGSSFDIHQDYRDRHRWD